MRWLITGAGGMLGRDLGAVLAEAGETDVVAATRASLDITDPAAVRAAVLGADVVINAAAWTDVDGAEANEEAATAVNGAAVRALAAAAGKRLIHLSTDYVFDGTAASPYAVDAVPAPRSAYGRTKAAGERAVAAAGGAATTVRTAWVYGRTGGNFVRTMVRLERERPTVSVVDDQTGSPTWSADLAAALVVLGARPDVPPPVLHYTNAGTATWYEVARAVFQEIGADPDRVLPTTSVAMARPARRPAYSVLDLTAWTAAELPAPRPWRKALAEALQGNFWD
jgi:dTDP-4-dehydrorhamnose reductase